MIRKNMTSLPNVKPVRWVLVACLRAFTLVAMLAPGVALAQEEEVERDARLEGYPSKVALDSDSTALMWILLIFLGGIGMGVMFKNAKRTHLD
jgi:hypothetical protein